MSTKQNQKDAGHRASNAHNEEEIRAACDAFVRGEYEKVPYNLYMMWLSMGS